MQTVLQIILVGGAGWLVMGIIMCAVVDINGRLPEGWGVSDRLMVIASGPLWLLAIFRDG